MNHVAKFSHKQSRVETGIEAWTYIGMLDGEFVGVEVSCRGWRTDIWGVEKEDTGKKMAQIRQGNNLILARK